MATNAQKIGWIGMGRMGLPMAERLLKAGHEVSIWNRTRDRKSTRLNSSHMSSSYAVFCLKKKKVAYEPSLVRINAVKKPATVIRPVKLWACSNASGIIVSANMARIAPAATAVVAAMTSAENRLKGE